MYKYCILKAKSAMKIIICVLCFLAVYGCSEPKNEPAVVNIPPNVAPTVAKTVDSPDYHKMPPEIEKMFSVSITIDFENDPLCNVMEFISAVTHQRIVINMVAIEKGIQLKKVTLKQNHQPAKDAF